MTKVKLVVVRKIPSVKKSRTRWMLPHFEVTIQMPGGELMDLQFGYYPSIDCFGAKPHEGAVEK